MKTNDATTYVLVLFWTMLAALLSDLPAAAQPVNLCGVFVDRTWSVDDEHRRRALGAVEEGLPTFLSQYHCDVLVLGQFADEGAWAPRRALRVPRPVEATCSDTLPATRGSRVILQHFSGFQEKYHSESLGVCENARAVSRQAFDAARRAFLDSARVYMNSVRPTEHPTRTAIVPLVRAVNSPVPYRALVIVTDGMEEVVRPIPSLPLPGNTALILVTVPAAETSGGYDATLAATAEWEAAVDGLLVVPYPQVVMPGAWRSDREPDMPATVAGIAAPRLLTMRQLSMPVRPPLAPGGR